MKVRRLKIFIYILLPASLSLLMMTLFYSGIPALENIVVPTITGLHSNSWREFGLLENLQHLYILLISLFCAHAVTFKRNAPEKLFAFFTVLAALFILLEEIDYGLHYYEWVFNIAPEERVETRNLHNTSKETLQNIRRVVDVAMAFFFLILPFCAHRFRSGFIHYITPSRWLFGTGIVLLVLSEIAHVWDDYFVALQEGARHKLYKNVSEFRELTLYYMFMLYFYELMYKRDWSTIENRYD